MSRTECLRILVAANAAIQKSENLYRAEVVRAIQFRAVRLFILRLLSRLTMSFKIVGVSVRPNISFQSRAQNLFEGFLPSPQHVGVSPTSAQNPDSKQWNPQRLHHLPTAEEFQAFVARREPFVIALNDPEAAHLVAGALNRSNLHRSVVEVEHSGKLKRGAVPLDSSGTKDCPTTVKMTGHSRWRQHLMGVYTQLNKIERIECGGRSSDIIYGMRNPFPHDSREMAEDKGSCEYVAFLFYSSQHHSWNVGSRDALHAGSTGWIVGIPLRSADNFVSTTPTCPTDVGEWAVAGPSGQNEWTLDVGLQVNEVSSRTNTFDEVCQQVPSGRPGVSVERFNCKLEPSTKAPVHNSIWPEPCPPLLKALGWEKLCLHWNADYLCRATGRKVVSLAMSSNDTATHKTTFGGVCTFRPLYAIPALGQILCAQCQSSKRTAVFVGCHKPSKLHPILRLRSSSI